MRARRAIPFLLAPLLFGATAHASDVLRRIDEAYAAGAIDRGERQLLRVAAVRAPTKLPEPWRGIALRELERRTIDGRAARSRSAREARDALSSRPTKCHTPLMVEALHELPTLDPNEQATLRDLLAPPADLAYSIESDTPYPVRVSYGDPSLQHQAERVLAAVGASYERIVQELGFWEPPVEPAIGSYRFFVRDAGDAAGYTVPYATNGATDHADAFSYIVIDPWLDDLSLDVTVAHEFTHATQAAMDVEEVVAFWENTATVVESDVYPLGWPYTTAMFGYFQSQASRPLEYMNMHQSDLYEYGGALWAHFLRERYGSGDSAFLRRIWEGTVQAGAENEPDYFDVIDSLLEDDGGLSGAVREFSEARFFVGFDDDGQHLTDAGQWGGAEVPLTASLSLNQLPILDAGPLGNETLPQPNGCNYVRLRASEAVVPIRVTFRALGAEPWLVRAMRVGSGSPTTSLDLPLDDVGAGELSVPLDGYEQLVLSICQAMVPGYDPDDHDWPKGDYRYSLEHNVPLPVIDRVEPDTLERGASEVEVMVHGRDFIAGAGLTVRAEGEGVQLHLVERVSDETLRVRATVDSLAPLGPRDIVVSNPGGMRTTGSGMITVVRSASSSDGLPEPSGGCACATPSRRGGPSAAVAALWALGLVAAGRRRRRASAEVSRRRAGGRPSGGTAGR